MLGAIRLRRLETAEHYCGGEYSTPVQLQSARDTEFEHTTARRILPGRQAEPADLHVAHWRCWRPAGVSEPVSVLNSKASAHDSRECTGFKNHTETEARGCQ